MTSGTQRLKKKIFDNQPLGPDYASSTSVSICQDPRTFFEGWPVFGIDPVLIFNF